MLIVRRYFIKQAIASSESMRLELFLKTSDARVVARGIFRCRQNLEPDRVPLQATQPKHPLQWYGEISATLTIFRRKAAAKKNCHALFCTMRSLESTVLDRIQSRFPPASSDWHSLVATKCWGRAITTATSAAILVSLGGFLSQPIAAQQLDASDTIQGFPVGPQPYGLTSDGDNIWVTSFDSTEMTKLRASDGANLGAFFAGGKTLFAVFDGANIWATNYVDNNVTELQASNGSPIGNFPVGSLCKGLAFDGTNIWAVNNGDNTVMKLRKNTGAVLNIYRVEFAPEGIFFDGTSIWVACNVAGTSTRLT